MSIIRSKAERMKQQPPPQQAHPVAASTTAATTSGSSSSSSGFFFGGGRTLFVRGCCFSSLVFVARNLWLVSDKTGNNSSIFDSIFYQQEPQTLDERSISSFSSSIVEDYFARNSIESNRNNNPGEKKGRRSNSKHSATARHRLHGKKEAGTQQQLVSFTTYKRNVRNRKSSSKHESNNAEESQTQQPIVNFTTDKKSVGNNLERNQPVLLSSSSPSSSLSSLDDALAVPPPIVRGIVHAPLPSLPSYHRMPQSVILQGSTATKQYLHNWTDGTSPHQYMMYNPSLVVLPESLRSDFNNKNKNNNDGTTTRDGADAEYLVSYRFSSVHSCGFDTYEFWKYRSNLFGFALLDRNLGLVPGSDVVVDLIAYYGEYSFDDLRLFVFDGGATIYLSHEEKLFPIRIYPPASTTPKEEAELRIPNLYGNGMQLFQAGQKTKYLTIKREGKNPGKNFQFFLKPPPPSNSTAPSLPSTSSWQVLMEKWVAGPRQVVEYKLSSFRLSSSLSLLSFDDYRFYSWKEVEEHKSDHPHSVAPTIPEGLGTDGWTPRDRASACCVRIDSEYYRDLLFLDNQNNKSSPHSWWQHETSYILVGVSHVKSRARLPHQNTPGGAFHYLSRLYAFSPVPPYPVVARSGLVCFGTGRGESDDDVVMDPYATAFGSERQTNGTNRMFQFQGQINNRCPRIHFVSGISEKVGDPSKMILAYGVSDCYSRMVEIHKRDFAKHLFAPTGIL